MNERWLYLRSFACYDCLEAWHEARLAVMIPADLDNQHIPLSEETGGLVTPAGLLKTCKRRVVAKEPEGHERSR